MSSDDEPRDSGKNPGQVQVSAPSAVPVPESMQGILFIVSGPSGSGKTTISDAALRAFPGLTLSVSWTTRAPRPGETDGVEYTFVDDARFEEMIRRGEMAEWAEVHGHRYGTPRLPLDSALGEGHDVLLDIDVQGAAQVRHSYPGAVAVFLLPPDRGTLEMRLRGRGTDSEATVRRRLEGACREIARADEYDHVIVNRNKEEAIADFEGILRDAHLLGPAHVPRRRAGMQPDEFAAFLRSFGVGR